MQKYLVLTAALFAGAAASYSQTPTPTPTPAPNYIAMLRPTAPRTPPTGAQIAAQTATLVPQETATLFNTINSFARALWANPINAQSVVDALGERAAPLFVIYGEIAGPLAVIDPASYARLPQIPTGYGWTILPPDPTTHTWPAGQRSVAITYPTPPPAPSPAQ